MGGLFGPKAPEVAAPIAPAAPVQEATFQAGVDETDTAIKKKKAGKKILQIPTGTTTTAPVATGLSTGV